MTHTQQNNRVENFLAALSVITLIYICGVITNNYVDPLFAPENQESPLDETKKISNYYNQLDNEALTKVNTPSSQDDRKKWYTDHANALKYELENRKSNLNSTQVTRITRLIERYSDLNRLDEQTAGTKINAK